jgi:hypothetical protein
VAELIPTVTVIKQEEEQLLGGWNRAITPHPPIIYNPRDIMHW